jgi:excisionase family DNA binding protein
MQIQQNLGAGAYLCEMHGNIKYMDIKQESQQSAELLNLSEAASMLRLRPSTLRAWRLNQSHLPFVKIGRRVFVRRSDLQDLVNASLVPPIQLKRK